MVRCVSLFSGAGGLDVGASISGAKIELCIELDADSVATLKANIPRNNRKDIIEGDICKFDFKGYRSGREPIVVIGGPPCQPFSKNGYWVKNENRLPKEDPRNLLKEFLRAVDELSANSFLFENVESMLHPTNRMELEKFISQAESMGYSVNLVKVNSADFGVPQKRKRIFIFGFKGKIKGFAPPKPTHAKLESNNLFSELPNYVGVKDFIAKYSGDEYFEPSEVAYNGTYFQELMNVPPGKNYIALSNLNNYEGKTFTSGGRFWNFLHKLHPDLPSITIAAQPGPWVGPFHWENRRLRVPEIAAIQTFPEGYAFFGSRRSVQRQIGNAVPCLLGQRMFEHLMRYI